MNKRASLALGLDYFVRLSILEGVTGVTRGSWTRRGAGLNLLNQLVRTQSEYPKISPEWFSDRTSILYPFLAKKFREFSDRSSFGGHGSKSRAYTEDALSEFISSDKLYKAGHEKRMDILGGAEPKAVLNYLWGAIKNFMFNYHRNLERQEMRGRGDATYHGFDGDHSTSADPLSEALSDPSSPAGKAVYTWLNSKIDDVDFRSKAGWDGAEVYRKYLDNMRRDRALLDITIENEDGEMKQVPKGTASGIVSLYTQRLTEMAANDRGLKRILADFASERDRQRTTQSVYDRFENMERVANAFDLSNALLAFAGGERKLELVFDGDVMKDYRGFSVMIPTTETRYGEANMLRIWSDGKNRVYMGLYFSKPGMGTKTVKVLDLVTAGTIPKAISNAFQIQYHVPLPVGKEIPLPRVAKKN